MGTRWDHGWEIGLVAMTLGLAVGCGGEYDVGSGEAGGQGNGGGNSGGGSGGQSGAAQGGSATGGRAATGGQGAGGAVSATGGTSVGGAAGASTGGSMNVECGTETVVFSEYPMAPPDVVWERLSRFLYGEVTEPLEPLPEKTSEAWVRDRVRAILREHYEAKRPPAGLEQFVRTWAFDGDEDADAETWASAFAQPTGNFGNFFAEQGDRVSILSDPSFLVAHPTPTKRGSAMMRQLFCINVSPHPQNVNTTLTVPPNTTRRQALEARTAEADVCAGCHHLTDPIGFSLEHYDELGNHRTTENGQPIDSSGTLYEFSMPLVWSSIDDLSVLLGGMCETQSCFATTLFAYALDQAYSGAPPDHGANEEQYVRSAFVSSSLSLAPLVEAIVRTPAFLRE